MGLRALKFYWHADTLYNVHSPYLFELLETILDRSQVYYDFDLIEGKRQALLASQEEIDFVEMGAGSRHLKSTKRKIKDIARTSLSPSSQCQILYRLIEKIKPTTVLEMGSSLGLSTAYLSSACTSSKLISLEGDPKVAETARQLLRSLNIKNAEIITGNFTNTLDKALTSLKAIDIVFIDGHHTYDATIKYYHQIKPYIHDDTLIIFDDVHWTEGMDRAWKEIRSREDVTASIDFFYFGIISFKKEFLSKVHHDIVPTYLKPWCVFEGI